MCGGGTWSIVRNQLRKSFMEITDIGFGDWCMHGYTIGLLLNQGCTCCSSSNRIWKVVSCALLLQVR